MKSGLSGIILLLLLLLPLGQLGAKDTAEQKSGTASLQWGQAADELERLQKKALQESNILSDFASMVSRDFTLEQKFATPLSIVAGGQTSSQSGDTGQPDYHPAANTLSLPYSYLGAAVQAQAEIVEDRQQALTLALDMIEYTLYHLFGHVLAADNSVDADQLAEDISTWIMLTRWPNGGEQWLASLRAFGKASQVLDGPLSDYWHAHSLYKSRQAELECAVLGSDPQRYEPLMQAVLDPQARRNECTAQWQALSARVTQLLAPVLRAQK